MARSAQTDGQGHYTLPNMPPGTYSVSASANGFVAFSKPDVSVPAGTASPLDIALQIATETQQVQVSEYGDGHTFYRRIEQCKRAGFERSRP